MKQLQQSIRTGCISVAEVPVPRGGHGRVLVQVAASLISAGTERMLMDFGSKNLLAKARARPDLVRQVLEKAQREGLQTTLEALRSRMDQPMALGYSCAGTVIEVGEDVDDVRVGDRVACAGGGYAVHAEIVSVPHKLVVRLTAAESGGTEVSNERGGTPGETASGDTSSREIGETPSCGIAPAQGASDHVRRESALGTTFEQAAFTTLGAIALQGLRLADVKLGETIAVLGLGVVGQLTAQMLKAAGCTVVGMDVRPERARLARESGADAVATDAAGLVSAVHQTSSGQGADAVLITADTPSNQPVEMAGQIARDRGVVVAVGAVGTEVPRKIYYDKELAFRISRSYGPGRYDPEYEEHGRDYPIGYVRWTEQRNMQAFAHLLATRKVDVQPLISHRFPLTAAPAAYDLIGGKTGEPFLGVLLTYPERRDTARTVQLRPRVPNRGLPAPLAAIGLLGAGNFATTTLLPAMK
ncbi:MAG: zinc-binding dehydrogenase, partial [Chloroflexota bacterium]|nr:zinc-binding dehydrogenase [Chloroflexota bacterium]